MGRSEPITDSDGSSGLVSPPATGLDIEELELFTAGLAPSTQKVYRAGVARYSQFCKEGRLTPFPVLERMLMLFVGFLHQQGLVAGTAKSDLAAVRHEQICRGMGNPNINLMPRLEYVLKGMKKVTPASSRRRLPITPEILLKLKAVWQSEPKLWDAKMLWAASCLSFFGFLQLGEVVMPAEKEFDPQSHLCFDDIRVDNRSSPSLIQVTIKASKTDPFWQGNSPHRGNRREHMPSESGVELHGDPGLFPWATVRVGGQAFFDQGPIRGELTCASLSAAGYAANDYAGHSFRIGAATTAARQGVQDSLIKTLGRWESAAYTRYIQTAHDVLCRVVKTLVGAGDQSQS